MAQPPPYDPITDFSAEEASQVSGRSTLRNAMIDQELSNLKATLDAILVNLALLQRDDTELANETVGFEQLKDEVVLRVDAFNTA